jgi:glutamate-1-semialdehyde 2,1-aminomutase
MGNGFSVAALVGRREIMELGGLFHGKPRVFLISTTHGAENHSLAAARAVIRSFREQPVIDHMWRIGGQLLHGLNDAARAAGVAGHFKAFGFPCNPAYAITDETGAASPGLRTLFMQEMVKAGVLIPYIAPALAHSDADVARTVEAAQGALRVVARGLDGGWQKLLDGPPVKPVFREFN